MLIAEMRRLIERKMADAILQSSPFPHLIIENFFPAEIYEKITAYNPFLNNVGEEWMTADSSKNVSSRTPYHARKQINFHANTPFKAGPDATAFWNALKNCFLGSNWFEGLVVRKYNEYFTIRFGDLVEDPKFLTYFRKELFLQRHEPGYYIGPHTDIPTRVFTCIFSFAAGPGFEDLGTQLLAHKDPLVRCWGNDHYSPDDFVVKKLAPYAPNNFLLFFKTRQSFHSVKDIGNKVPNQRYGMQFQFYEPGGGLFKDLSVPDLMVTRHSVAPPLQPTVWVAKTATILKKTAALASVQPPEHKLAVDAGDAVMAERFEVHGDHTKLIGVTQNGRALGIGTWFAFTSSWDRQQLAAANPIV